MRIILYRFVGLIINTIFPGISGIIVGSPLVALLTPICIICAIFFGAFLWAKSPFYFYASFFIVLMSYAISSLILFKIKEEVNLKKILYLSLYAFFYCLLFSVNPPPFYISVLNGSSSYPNLIDGEITLDVGEGYEIIRGDFVTFKFPGGASAYSKRVIGLPGEKIFIENGVVYINDVPLEEKYKNYDGTCSKSQQLGPITVPDDSYFVLGDNRCGSIDSRHYHYPFIQKNQILGKKLYFIWSKDIFKLGKYVQ
ncbi:signal peptidase I [Microbulbifer thermotolerans]|uniref:Signal peptidase I n=1 Tax=Microbulbifer thermotolerans TaxID=252514 RepID=A0AB35I3E5_MICTH|nr:signal peptidase I [Microbulbifer thermotolerans]MCX2778369.1 signal peptidase I [Microbulbifer thermotolerans]MCX2803193.1 signal peptidase I [Microbulbifer thermotolerans]MCX2804408.1 signal peptidase I [Microbulbifer thermotolerans]MCX2832556.1 signal peptidase I [Microbulbifer thermotolerans]MCX2842739.1 signal peptidase I [Microbulbifer thermotolerans]